MATVPGAPKSPRLSWPILKAL